MPLIRREGAAAPPDDTAADLETGTADQRWTAARRLAARPAAAARLGRALATEGDERVREAIFTSLVQIGGAGAVAAVLPHLKSDDAGLRGGALDALKAMPAAARECLPALLEDPDPDIRILACELARVFPDARTAALLARLLAAEAEVNVCAAAVEVLAEIGNADSIAPLADCAARFADRPFLGFAIKVAMRRIGAQRPPGHG